MKLVILGAGASYDAFKWYDDINLCHNWRPPLANYIFSRRDVFKPIYQKYPGSEAASHALSTIADIETYLQTQYDKAEEYNSVEIKKQLINLKFFLQDLFFQISNNLKDAGPSNLRLLIDLIHDYCLRTSEDVLVVSFNYDLLFEKELSSVFGQYGKKFDMYEYLQYKIKLVKPHGSCNWSTIFNNQNRIPNNQKISEYLMAYNLTQKELNLILEDIYLVDTPEQDVIKNNNSMSYKFPQIHIPMKGKDGFNMPKDQTEYLKNYLPKVDEILIVGWKGNEELFNKTLQEYIGNKPVKIQIVNGYQKAGFTEPVLTNLSGYINTNNVEIFNGEVPSTSKLNIKDQEKINFINSNGSGSLTSFLLNIENQLEKSIFCK